MINNFITTDDDKLGTFLRQVLFSALKRSGPIEMNVVLTNKILERSALL